MVGWGWAGLERASLELCSDCFLIKRAYCMVVIMYIHIWAGGPSGMGMAETMNQCETLSNNHWA